MMMILKPSPGTPKKVGMKIDKIVDSSNCSWKGMDEDETG
jgi:hypothetical protein